MLSDQVIRRIRRLLARGKPQRAIAKELNVSPGTVLAVHLRTRLLVSEVPEGCKLDGSMPEPQQRSANRHRKRVAAMYREGKTLRGIATVAGVSYERVRKWLVQDGVARRKRGRKPLRPERLVHIRGRQDGTGAAEDSSQAGQCCP